MNKFLFYIFIKPLSLLPHWVLYKISDVLFLMIYYLFGYRKEVIFTNLQNSFPEKTPAELKTIAKKFYQHFCDLVVESIKTFSISEKELLRRCKIRNPQTLQKYFDQGKSVIIPAGHYNNWELAATASHLQIPHQSVGAYQPMKSDFFNQVIEKSRRKFGLELIPIKQLSKYFKEYSGVPMAMLFGSDQCPRKVHLAHWMEFLNQETGVMFGTEKYAKQYDYPVLFGKVEKIKRGFYEFEFILITDQPKESAHGEITEAHTRMLEQCIIERPEYWLWSHKRWKRKRKTNSSSNVKIEENN